MSVSSPLHREQRSCAHRLRSTSTQTTQESEGHHLSFALREATHCVEHQIDHIRRLQDDNSPKYLGQWSQDEWADGISQEEYGHDKCLLELGLDVKFVPDDLKRRRDHGGGDR